MRGRSFCRLAFPLILFTLVANSFAQKYTITDLGTLPGGNSALAWGMNSSAHVVGYASPSSHPFFWTPTDGISDIGCGYGNAESVNDTDRVVGFCGPDSDSGTAFLWTPGGGIHFLGTLPGGTSSTANGVNSLNQVVGTSFYGPNSSNDLHAFLWTSTAGMKDLGAIQNGQYSFANAINRSGQVVGYSEVGSTGVSHGFIWTAATGMIDLGALPNGTSSDAAAINDLGLIVGNADTGKQRTLRAVQWKNGKIHNLGLLNNATYSFATSINHEGGIVGESGPAGVKGKDVSHAVIWRNGNLLDLNKLTCGTNLVLYSARAINDSGEIAGYAMFDGSYRAFLASPTKSCQQ